MGQRRPSRVRERTVDHLRRAADFWLAALLDPRCVACGQPLARPLDGPCCAACWSAIDAGGRYDGTLRAVIHAFKYDGRRSLAPPLAALMRARGADVLAGADAVVPVPLHPLRRLRRGFNQAADLAALLGPPVIHALWRRRHTPPQTRLGAARRAANVGGAFVLSPLLHAARRAALLDHRVVVLVDDVRTTGATLEACARVLRAAGAREVRTLTAAQAPPP